MLLKILMLTAMSTGTSSADSQLDQPPKPAAQTIFHFKNLKDDQHVIVNDTVMGGRSNSQVLVNQNVAVFKGQVSLENNGGFASMRTIWPFNAVQSVDSNFLIKLQLKGDGKSYQFRLRTDRGMDGAAYSYSFETLAGQRQDIYIPLDQLIPTFRGRTLDNMPALMFSDVQQMGIMIADKQTKPFSIELYSIELK